VAKVETTAGGLQRLLAGADKTYAALPQRLQLEIENVVRGLPEVGPRMLRRAGPGMEYFDQRDFDPEIDERRHINARLSARAAPDPHTGEPREIVVVKEAEIRQQVYLWRDASGSMDIPFDPKRFTKKESSEIMLLAMARHLARNEDMVGILDGRGTYRGGSASSAIASSLFNVTVIASDTPHPQRKLPRNSTAILFSDGGMSPDDFARRLQPLKQQGLDVYMVLVLDAQEIDFNYDGHFEFQGAEGDGVRAFSVSQGERAHYRQLIGEHLRALQSICEANQVKLILQRTDEPLKNALLSIYGVRSRTPDFTPKVELK